MAERRSHAEDLSRYWDALNSGETSPDPGALDPEETAFVLTMVAHARRAQIPAGARERARDAALRQFALTHAQRRNGGTAMQLGTLSAPAPLVPPRPFVVRPARPQWWERGAAIIGVAALIVAMIGGVFFTYRDHGPSSTTLPAVIASPTTSVVATPATPAAASVFLPPNATMAGLTLGEWGARFDQWLTSLMTTATDPALDTTGARCGFGQNGPVFFLAPPPPGGGERRCAVPSGSVLLVMLIGHTCDTAEPDPELRDPAHASEAQLRACAKTNIDLGLAQDLATVALVVDGASVDIHPYRAATPLHQIVFPPNNESGVAPGVAQVVGDGYAVLIRPLAAGEHTVVETDPGGNRVTYHLTVAAPPSAGSAATPAA